ncbi:hypothetical protein WJX73_010061 [Symbiochloris irregularis]|uniref:Uncharacterized protein n=1 Tax=Symbiochloris irregularis TaxID=706552 RepID=A0AAW1PRP3_9CHLO
MAGKAITNFLKKIPGLKAPWEITGPAASIEHLSPTPPATEYRKRAPGSQIHRARVPQATPDTVYDITFYNRDVRRQGQLVGGTNRKRLVKYEVDPKENQLQASDVPPTMGQPTRWTRKPLLEYDNNGYT